MLDIVKYLLNIARYCWIYPPVGVGHVRRVPVHVCDHLDSCGGEAGLALLVERQDGHPVHGEGGQVGDGQALLTLSHLTQKYLVTKISAKNI